MEQKLRGRLIFSGSWLERPWALIQADGSTVDAYPSVDAMLKEIDGKPARHDFDYGSYFLMLDESSDDVVVYEPDKIAWLEGTKKISASNIATYLEDVLARFSGRIVDFDFSERGLTVTADPAEDVFRVRWNGGSGSCVIPDGAEMTVCKVGTPEGCIFLVGTGAGFECAKFGNLGRQLLGRRSAGKMRSTRVGSCALDETQRAAE